MKKYWTFLIMLILLCFTGCSDGKTDTDIEPDYWDKSHCQGRKDLAKSIMEFRQEGHSFSVLMSQGTGAPKEVQEMVRDIALKAFEEPVYSSEAEKLKAVQEFKSTVYDDCIIERIKNK